MINEHADRLFDATSRSRAVLTRAVTRHCPPWLSEHADDLVQIALMKVLERKGESLDTLADAYLWRVAYTVIIDEIRRRRRRPEEGLTAHESSLSASSAESDPEVGARASRIRAAIADCLSRLRTPRRLAVTLYLQGHSVPEVAGLLHWDRKKGENNVFRGMADLRACLTKKGMDP